MQGMRVHELAADWGVPSKEVVARLERIGIRGKKSQSSLTEDELARVKSELGLVERRNVVLGTQRVVAERVRTHRDEEHEELITAREQTVESRIATNVIRRRTQRVEVLKRETLPPIVPGSADQALQVPPPAPPPGMPPVPPPPVVAAPGAAAAPAAPSHPPVAPSLPEAPAAVEAPLAPEVRAAAAPAPPPAAPAPPPVAPAAAAASTLSPQVAPAEPKAPELDSGVRPVKVLGKIDLRKTDLARGPSRPPAEAPMRPVPGGPPPGEMPGATERDAGRKAKKRKEVIRKQDQLEELERRYRPGGGKRPQKRRALPGKEQKKTEITVAKASKRVVKIQEMVTVGDLARAMGVKAGEVVKKLMEMGMMATINQSLDSDIAAVVAGEFDYTVDNVAFDAEAALESGPEEAEGPLEQRPPVITMMGHVDHGKTSLLDAIRETEVAAGEAGGITQHIGAYTVTVDGRCITFLDTPGHEAFTAMRARGAKVTDIVVLVVAADDGIMPQTVEAINHAKAAGVPMVVAVNKIDKPDGNVERVKQELANHGLVPEEWGGDTVVVPVSARTRQNLPQLLEMVLLQADVLDLRANPRRLARGTIVEAKLDRGRGPVATVLVQDGTLRTGDALVCGTQYGRIRAMLDDHGQKVSEAGPSTPVEVLGLSGVVEAGDSVVVLGDEAKARQVAEHRRAKEREADMAKTTKVSLEELYQQIQAGGVKEVRVVLKADVHGSVEAVNDALRRLSTDEVRLNVLHSSVGGITESDVLLASASNAIVVGFNVRPESKASSLASREGVDIRLYTVIYDAVNDVRSALEGLLAPTLRERSLGRAEVRQIFTISGLGTVAGCAVVEGKITRSARIRLVRDSVVIYTGTLSSLKRFKDDVREVATGYECGLALENYQDVKVGDVVEAFEIEQVARRLEATAAAAAPS
jgi:translation initiation factor IF-2